jgi:rRNA maturation endonuclease Nob1
MKPALLALNPITLAPAHPPHQVPPALNILAQALTEAEAEAVTEAEVKVTEAEAEVEAEVVTEAEVEVTEVETDPALTNINLQLGNLIEWRRKTLNKSISCLHLLITK